MQNRDSAFVQIKIGEYVFPREAFSFAPYSLRSKYSYNELKLRTYRPILYRNDGTANLVGKLVMDAIRISSGGYQVPVPSNVISKYSIEIVGDMYGPGETSAYPPTWVTVDLRRESISSGEVESIDLIRVETKDPKPFNFVRSADIDRWINSDDAKDHTLSLYIDGAYFDNRFDGPITRIRGDISMRVNVTHN